ncbi:hypothetical protein ABC733_07455 [Mangrovibacter sp. SLW1]
MSPNKNQENQFIDFRLLTKRRKNHAFSFFFINLKARSAGFIRKGIPDVRRLHRRQQTGGTTHNRPDTTRPPRIQSNNIMFFTLIEGKTITTITM